MATAAGAMIILGHVAGNAPPGPIRTKHGTMIYPASPAKQGNLKILMARGLANHAPRENILAQSGFGLARVPRASSGSTKCVNCEVGTFAKNAGLNKCSYSVSTAVALPKKEEKKEVPSAHRFILAENEGNHKKYDKPWSKYNKFLTDQGFLKIGQERLVHEWLYREVVRSMGLDDIVLGESQIIWMCNSTSELSRQLKNSPKYVLPVPANCHTVSGKVYAVDNDGVTISMKFPKLSSNIQEYILSNELRDPLKREEILKKLEPFFEMRISETDIVRKATQIFRLDILFRENNNFDVYESKVESYKTKLLENNVDINDEADAIEKKIEVLRDSERTWIDSLVAKRVFYRLPAPIGLEVEVELIFEDHVHWDRNKKYDAPDHRDRSDFIHIYRSKIPTEGSSPEDNTVEVFRIREDRTRWLDMDYESRETRILDLSLYGSLCKHPLGEGTFNLVVPGDSCYDFRDFTGEKGTKPGEIVMERERTAQRYVVPAHKFEIVLAKIASTHKLVDGTRPEITDADGFGYFHRLDTRRRKVDFTEENITLSYIYHPKTDLRVEFTGRGASYLQDKCDAVVSQDEDGKAGDELEIKDGLLWNLQAGAQLKATVWATVTVGNGNPACDYVNGNVSIVNRLGLSPDEAGEDLDKLQEILSRSLGQADYNLTGKGPLQICSDFGECKLPTIHTDSSVLLHREGYTDCEFDPYSEPITDVDECAKKMMEFFPKLRLFEMLDWAEMTKDERENWRSLGWSKKQWDARDELEPDKYPDNASLAYVLYASIGISLVGFVTLFILIRRAKNQQRHGLSPISSGHDARSQKPESGIQKPGLQRGGRPHPHP
eukprot:UC4_evm2s379